MSIRLALALITCLAFAFALDVGLTAHYLNGAKAATSQVVNVYRYYPGAMDAPGPCPAAARNWCQSVGGLAQ